MKVKKKTLIKDIEEILEFFDKKQLANAKYSLNVILYSLRNDVIECDNCNELETLITKLHREVKDCLNRKKVKNEL